MSSGGYDNALPWGGQKRTASWEGEVRERGERERKRETETETERKRKREREREREGKTYYKDQEYINQMGGTRSRLEQINVTTISMNKLINQAIQITH